MSTHEKIFIILGAVCVLIALFFFYLPADSRLQELKSEIRAIDTEIEALRRSLPERMPEKGELEELTVRWEQIMAIFPREVNYSAATEAIVSRSRQIKGIEIDSIVGLGKAEAVEEGIERWLIKIVMKSSFSDFARFLHSLIRAEVPFAVEEFIIENEDNASSLSRIEMTVTTCVYRPVNK